MLIPPDELRQMAEELEPYLMSALEVAGALGVSVKFVYSLADRGRLVPVIKKHKHLLWLEPDVKAYMVTREEEGYR